MNNLMKLAQARLCCPTIDQIGAAALYNLDPSYFDDIKKEYEHRRNVSVEALNEIEGIKYGVPEGAFYITAQLPVDNAEDFLMFLLTEFDVNGETVMFAPAGGFFGTPGVEPVRYAYSLCTQCRRHESRYQHHKRRYQGLQQQIVLRFTYI